VLLRKSVHHVEPIGRPSKNKIMMTKKKMMMIMVMFVQIFVEGLTSELTI